MDTYNTNMVGKILVKGEKERERKKKKERGVVHQYSQMYVVVGFKFDI